MGAEPVRVAIVGAGVGAEHLRAYEQRGDEFAVTWLCDLDEERAAAAAGRAAVRIAADWRAALADDKVGLVDVCLPPHLHCEAALAALAAGKHVVCEKPLCLALADADRLAAAEREHGRRIYPVFQYRFNRGPRLLRRLAASGRAGRLLLAAAQTHWNRLPAYYTTFRGRWATDGVGAAGIHAIHVHDIVASCLGPVRSAYARLDLRVNAIETDDTAALVMELADGGLFSSSITLGAASDYSHLHVSFEHLAVDSGRDPQLREDWRLTPRSERGEELAAELGGGPREPAGFAGLFAEIAKDLRGEASAAVRLADARASIELLTAIYASHARRAPAALPCAPADPLYQGWRDAHGVRPREG